MNRARLIVAAVVGVALVVAVVSVIRGRDGTQPTATATRGTIDVTIQTVGSIQIPDAPLVRTRVGGVVDTFGVSAGERVLAGDILLILDQEPFHRAVADAEAAVVQAEYALQLAELRLSDSPDDPALSFDVLNAADRVARSERGLEDARRSLRQSVIVAPSDGIVVEVQARRGDVVGPNQGLVRIAAPADFRLVADVDELDLPNVAIGATVRFRLDAYPATEIEGMVASTAPIARQQGGTTVFATTVTIDLPPDLDIRPGMNADVTIVTDAREGVLLIPDAALRTVGNRSYVVVVTDGRREEREVTLGYRGQGQAEVVAGLSDGDRVVLR